MDFDDQTKKTPVNKNQSPVCPKCKFKNNSTAIYCEICFYPLNATIPQFKKPDSNKTQSASIFSNPEQNYSAQANFFSPRQSNNNKTAISTHEAEITLKQELQKPSVISGLVVLFLAIAFWLNFFISRQSTPLSPTAEDEIILYDSMHQVKNVPPGLFSYGGALYFASLVAHGINDAVTQNHPEFNLRYTRSTNQSQNYVNGIKMLLDGELSFAFNDRSLTDEEYARAELRNIDLLQIPIAIDGVAFFSNSKIKVNNLTLEQVRDIFTGKISNWQQLGGINLPITPILLTPQNLEVLGIEARSTVPQATKYVPNYTLAIRRVIATPGAISFASASLIQDQQGIKVLNLADKDSAKFIAPIVGGQADLKLFQNGTYPLTRRLFVVIRQDGTPDQLAGTAYAQMLLSHQGQEIVEQAGFVPLYLEQ